MQFMLTTYSSWKINPSLSCRASALWLFVSFSRIFHRSDEFFANFLETPWVLAFLLCCWRLDVADVVVASSYCCCWCPCWMLLSFLLLLTFLLSDAGGPAAVDIHDVPIFPATAVISDVKSVPKCCCWIYYFCKHPRFCWRPYCFGRPLVAFIPAVAFFSTVVGSQAIAVILVACCWLHYCFLHTWCWWHSCCCGRPFTLAPDLMFSLLLASLLL